MNPEFIELQERRQTGLGWHLIHSHARMRQKNMWSIIKKGWSERQNEVASQLSKVPLVKPGIDKFLF